MLKLSEVELKKNLLLVEEYPLDIKPQTDAGIHKSEDQLNEERARRRFRIGKIVKWGWLDDQLVEDSGLHRRLDEDNNLELIEDQNILYTADAVELVDIPIEDTKRLLMVNLHNIIGVVNFEDDLVFKPEMATITGITILSSDFQQNNMKDILAFKLCNN